MPLEDGGAPRLAGLCPHHSVVALMPLSGQFTLALVALHSKSHGENSVTAD